MDNGGVMDERNNPKALLVPGTVPLPIHNLVNINDSSDSEDNLPSTIDFDALKVPGLPETSFQNVMSWRGGAPRVKVKQTTISNESPKKETKQSLAYEAIASVSDMSSKTQQSASEDSDSDSESSSGSDSSSGTSSSSSSESDSGSRSSGTDSSSKKVKSRVVGKPTNKPRDSYSVSNSSSSSRHKNRVAATNYEPGSLKLRVSVFDQPVVKSKDPPSTPVISSAPDPAAMIKPPSESTLSGSKWKTARLSINGGIPSNNLHFDKIPTPALSSTDSTLKRITRQSQTNSEVPSANGQNSNNNDNNNGVLLRKTVEGLNLDKEFLPVGQTSQLTDSVTVTRVTAPRHSSPTVISPPKPQSPTRPLLSDPVRYLAEKKSGLTISPIASPPLSSQTGWNNTTSPPKVPFTLPVPNGIRHRHSITPMDKSVKNKYHHRSPSDGLTTFAEVKLRLPPKSDLSIHPISKEKEVEGHVFEKRSDPKTKPKKVEKSNGKTQLQEGKNRSKLSVFLPASSKAKVTGQQSQQSRPVAETKTRLKVRRPPKSTGCYTNPDPKPPPYTGKTAMSIVEKKKAMGVNLFANGTPVILTSKKVIPLLNGTVPESNTVSESKLIPMRTKGAKKYIPEPGPTPIRQMNGTIKTDQGIKPSPRKKMKRSRSEELVNGNGQGSRKRHKKSKADEDDLALCEPFKGMNIGRSTTSVGKNLRGKFNRSGFNSDSGGFAFEKKDFKICTPPPFPIHPTTRRDSTSPVKSHGSRLQGGSSPSTPSRRRRGTRTNSTFESFETPGGSSPDLQKLPLKKRHGHGNQHYDGPSEECGEESGFVFGGKSLPHPCSTILSTTSSVPFPTLKTNLYFDKGSTITDFRDVVSNNQEPSPGKKPPGTIPALTVSKPFETPVAAGVTTEKSGTGKRGRPRKILEPVPVPGTVVVPKVTQGLVPPPVAVTVTGKRSMRPRKVVAQPEEVKKVESSPEVLKPKSMSTSTSRGAKVKNRPPGQLEGVNVQVKVVPSESSDLVSPLGSPRLKPVPDTIDIPARDLRRRGRKPKTVVTTLPLPLLPSPPTLKIEPPPPVLIVRDVHHGGFNGRSRREGDVTVNEDLSGDAVIIDSDLPLEIIGLPDVNGLVIRHEGTLTPIPTPTRPPLKLIPTPSISPGSTGSGKKKRKQNRTGFPTKKKKKMPALIPIVKSAESGSTGSSTTEGPKPYEVNKTDLVSEEDDGTEDESSLERLPWTHTSFSASLVERVKMRRRTSTDLSIEERVGIESGTVQVPGVVPAFMDIPNPPIIMPHKSNYLKAGFLSSYYKQKEIQSVKVDKSIGIEELERRYGQPLTLDTLCPVPADTGIENVPVLPPESYKLPYDIWTMGVIRTRIALEDYCSARETKRGEDLKKKVENPTNTTAGEKGKGKGKSGLKRKRVSMPEHPPDSWTYKKLRINTYSNKPSTSTQETEDQTCDCKEGDFKCASDDCLNRVVFTECPPSCGEKCMNRRIQKHEWAPKLNRFLTEKKGYGVRSMAGIKKGDFILEYVGEVVTAAEFKERMHHLYANDTHHYCLQLDSGLVIDGHRSGGEGRFVNHSCEPNCHMQKWSVNGLSRMALFALRDIPAENELSYDYNFSLYNETEGQPCYCGSSQCRGVIGGKSKQSQNRRKNSSRLKGLAEASIIFRGHLSPSIKMKAIPRKDIKLARNVFLIRNYEKIRLSRGGATEEDERISERVERLLTGWVSRYRQGSKKNNPLVLTGEEWKVARVARLAQIFFELYKYVTSARDSSGTLLCDLFMELPLRRSNPIFYSSFDKTGLCGFKAIEKKIVGGRYKTIQGLEDDIRLVLTTFAQSFKTERPESAGLVDRIKKVYKDAKQKALMALEPFIIPESPSPPDRIRNRSGSPGLPRFLPPDPNDSSDRIRCICGTYSEEGTMIQCENCLVWQHCDCMGARTGNQPTPVKGSKGRGRRSFSKKLIIEVEVAGKVPKGSSSPVIEDQVQFDLGAVGISDELEIVEDIGDLETQVIVTETTPVDPSKEPSEEHYYCEKCDPREVDREVKLKGQEIIDRTEYLTLQREDGLVLRKNDTVYVLREWPLDQRLLPDGMPKPRKSYRTAGPLVKEECDIFRIDALWKDEGGKRFGHGYNYLRPHETHHEPSRKFYPNEVLRAPIHEIIDIDMVHGHCWVLDSVTYCKGRPIGCIEEHIYICDLRVNKAASSFDKVGKRSQAVCMKSFAFNYFETKIRINRNVHPHGPPSPDFKMRPSIQPDNKGGKGRGNRNKRKGLVTQYEKAQIARNQWIRRENLHCVITGMKVRIPDFNENPIDLWSTLDLVDGNRRSRKTKPYKISI